MAQKVRDRLFPNFSEQWGYSFTFTNILNHILPFLCASKKGHLKLNCGRLYAVSKTGRINFKRILSPSVYSSWLKWNNRHKECLTSEMTPEPLPKESPLCKKKKKKKGGWVGEDCRKMLLRPRSQNAESYSFIKTLQIGLALKPFIIKPICQSHDVKTLQIHW